MAARPTWKGYLKLSLVSCPVRLYNAVARSAKVSFHLLHKRTRNRIQMRPHDPELGAVERSDLVKGYQYDRYHVIFSDADPKSIKIELRDAILVEKFVDSGGVDQIYLEWSYYLAPDGTVAEETFRVIQWAMRKNKKVALRRIVSNLLPDFVGPRRAHAPVYHGRLRRAIH
jgi:DNA end-binding protein Ku